MKKSLPIVFNFWNPISQYFKKEIDFINEHIDIVSAFHCDFLGTKADWQNFLINYYALASDPPGNLKTVKVEEMRKKADYLSEFGYRFTTIIVDAKDDEFQTVSSLGNPYEPKKVGYIKKKIRDKYNDMGYNKWAIAHCFETYTSTNLIVEYIKENCKIEKIKIN